ncbi:MAG: isochorismate synthase [Deltaproteobacteria bacterium]|nr:isochorismate synthase [Deltaproteobacteria bacterium]
MIAGGLSHGVEADASAWPLEPVVAFARDALSKVLRGPSSIVMLCLPAPRARLTRLFDVPWATDNAFLWNPPTSPKTGSDPKTAATHSVAMSSAVCAPTCPATAGYAVARRIDLAHHESPADVARLGQAMLAEIEIVVHPALPKAAMVAPRFFGGLAFDGHASVVGPPWETFGAGSFILPRWTYVHGEGDSAVLGCIVSAEDAVVDDSGDSTTEAFVERLGATYRILATSDVRRSPHELEPASPVSVDETPVDVFSTQVEAIRSGIRAGRFGKVVAARRSVVRATRPLSVWRTMDALATAHPGTLKFAFSRGGRTFVGASPELLVSRTALDVRSEAVAGTIVTTEPDAARRLVESAKDREEHAFVVEHLVDRLLPFCGGSCGLSRQGPLVRRHGAVAHLVTSLTGQLKTPVHVLELVAALHPTPAVCGSPPEASAAFIRAHEPDPRGWYSGPVGWFDAHGQGEFWVALRSGVLHDQRAYLFAGAGIVGRSNPVAEYEETGLKFSTLLRALKVEPSR